MRLIFNTFTFIFVFTFFSKNAGAQIIFDSCFVKTDNDTLLLKSQIVLEKKIFYDTDTLKVKAFYHNRLEDFSFLYTDLLDSIEIFSNKTKYLNTNTEYYPFWQNYLLNYNQIFIAKQSNVSYTLIFSKPFFCNGFYCSSISVLVLSTSFGGNKCIEVNTEFCDYIELKETISEYIKINGQIGLPIIKDCGLKKRKIHWLKLSDLFIK